MALTKEYMQIDPNELHRANEHIQSFLTLDPSEYEGTTESYKKYDRVKPVYAIEQFDPEKKAAEALDEIKTASLAVIDGWKYVLFAREAKIRQVFLCKLTFDSHDDLVEIMQQLQRSNHDSYMALFMMIMALWPKHFKGQGFRSDTSDEELDKAVVGPNGKPLNIYQRIGLELYLSGNKVKQIRKVGMVNPLHFERIETSRFSLFAAYTECVKEERGEIPDAPAVKAPNYISTSTAPPEYGEPTATETPEYSEPDTTGPNMVHDEDEEPFTVNAMTIGAVEPAAEGEEEFVIVRGICQCCNQETKIKIYKNQAK